MTWTIDHPPPAARRRPFPRWIVLALVPTGVASLGAVGLLVTESNPAGSMSGLAAFGLIILSALVWLAGLLAFIVQVLRKRARGGWRWWLVAPVGGLLTIGLLSADVPLALRWRASVAAFDRRADRLLDADRTNDAVGRTGLFRVTDAHLGTHGSPTFAIANDGFFVYLDFVRVEPGDRPPADAEHLSGDWWYVATVD